MLVDGTRTITNLVVYYRSITTLLTRFLDHHYPTKGNKDQHHFPCWLRLDNQKAHVRQKWVKVKQFPISLFQTSLNIFLNLQKYTWSCITKKKKKNTPYFYKIPWLEYSKGTRLQKIPMNHLRDIMESFVLKFE